MFTEYEKFLVWKFSKIGNPVFFLPKKLMQNEIFFSIKYHVYWLLKSSSLKLFGYGKYGLLSIQKVDVRWYFL